MENPLHDDPTQNWHWTNRHWFKLVWLNLPPFILAAFIAYAAIEIFGDRNIETIHALSVTPNPARVGQPALIIFQGTQDNDCDGVVHRSITDSKGTLIQLDDVPVFHHNLGIERGKVFTFTKPFSVPLGLSPGTATYNSEAVRWCNSFQQFLYPVHDVYATTFEIK